MAGEQSAVSLGLEPRRVRLLVFVVASLLTGVLVSLSGAIGFVGLMLPHVARSSGGRRASPRCCRWRRCWAALFLVWVDVAARTWLAPQDLPIGIVTAAIGGVFFVALLRRRSGRADAVRCGMWIFLEPPMPLPQRPRYRVLLTVLAIIASLLPRAYGWAATMPKNVHGMSAASGSPRDSCSSTPSRSAPWSSASARCRGAGAGQ